VNLGGYHIKDVEIVAAIDIDKNKVGKDVAEAITVWPNNTYAFAKVPRTGVTVQRGMTHDGLGKYLSQIIQKAPGSTVDIVKLLRDTKTDVVVSYLPVGSEEATKWYVEQILEAGCAFVNCIPVFIAREKYWQQRFEKRGLLHCELALPEWDQPLHCVCVHLGLTAAARRRTAGTCRCPGAARGSARGGTRRGPGRSPGRGGRGTR